MNDPELITLRNRVLLGIFLVLIFTIPLIFFFINRYNINDPKIVKKINNKETMLVLITDNNCENCELTRKILLSENISYYELNIVKNNDYKEFKDKLSITDNEIVVPTLMYIKEGELYSTIVDIDEEELNEFIDYYELKK